MSAVSICWMSSSLVLLLILNMRCISGILQSGPRFSSSKRFLSFRPASDWLSSYSVQMVEIASVDWEKNKRLKNKTRIKLTSTQEESGENPYPDKNVDLSCGVLKVFESLVFLSVSVPKSLQRRNLHQLTGPGNHLFTERFWRTVKKCWHHDTQIVKHSSFYGQWWIG